MTVSFDPFSSRSPAYAATLPLFVVIFTVLILGVLIGGIAAWIGQGKWRRTARKLDADVRALHQELETIRRRFGTDRRRPPEPAPYRSFRRQFLNAGGGSCFAARRRRR